MAKNCPDTMRKKCEGYVKCAALDVANDQVAIVSVRPGVVDTDMLAVVMGSAESAASRGIAVSRMAPQFCEKIMAITKKQSGSHIDCGYKDV